MGFKQAGAYAGIEDHVPNDRYPAPPLGLHMMQITRAIRFEGTMSAAPTTVVEMKMQDSEDAKGHIGQMYSAVFVQDARYPGYYLGRVRGFVAAALGTDIGDVTGDVAERAINDRDNPRPGSCTGKMVGISVTPNDEKPQYPKIAFVSLA
jgi:hypothetical protein